MRELKNLKSLKEYPKYVQETYFWTLKLGACCYNPIRVNIFIIFESVLIVTQFLPRYWLFWVPYSSSNQNSCSLSWNCRRISIYHRIIIIEIEINLNCLLKYLIQLLKYFKENSSKRENGYMVEWIIFV